MLDEAQRIQIDIAALKSKGEKAGRCRNAVVTGSNKKGLTFR